MSERHRKLPPWMAKKEEKEKQPLRSRRKQKRARAAFYCMNERELVEAAVSYLTNAACEEDVVLTAEQRAADARMKMKENPSTSKRSAELVTVEESSACIGAPETTYVSESDVDVTELETVQYAESPQHQGPEPARHHDRLVDAAGLECEKRDESSQMAAEPDDALQLVREIFFT